MPVPIQRSDFRLDKIIGVAEALVGTDNAGDAFTVRRVGGTEVADLSDLILDWSAVPVDGNARKWFLYQQTEAQEVSGGAFFAALDGVFPVEVNLEIGGNAVEIASLERPSTVGGRKPRFAGLSGVRDIPTISSNGDALFANSRLGAGTEPYDLVQFDLILGVGLDVVSGLIVNVAADLPTAGIDVANPASAAIVMTEAGGINLQLGPQRAIWAQEIDRNTVPLESADGIEADQVLFEEVRSWITRAEISESAVIIVGDKQFGVQEVKPLNRSRFNSVSATRRYIGVSL